MVLLLHEEEALLSAPEEQEMVSTKLQRFAMLSTTTNLYILFFSRHCHEHPRIRISIWEAFQIGKQMFFNDLSKFKHLFISANGKILQTSLADDPFQTADRLNRRSNFRGNTIVVTVEVRSLSQWQCQLCIYSPTHIYRMTSINCHPGQSWRQWRVSWNLLEVVHFLG